MNLIDTNIILELLLEQEKAQEIKDFFETVPLSDICITEFSLHSIGIFLLRLKKKEIFHKFIEDLIENASIQVLGLASSELKDVMEISNKFNLDFDDAYQYAVAEKYNLQIISFDSDFDRTERGRRTPAEVTR